MRGGMHFYRGSGRQARAYVERDHADAAVTRRHHLARTEAGEYYLAEGSGVATRYELNGFGQVVKEDQLDGPGYEQWVEGRDLDGAEKGRLRSDDHALRFLEVIVNGPKDLSVAAAMDPRVSAAYDAAQDRAVMAIGRFVAQEATARLGPRGAQQQVHVERIDMAAVRHQTARGGDPHRHIHLQIGSRVLVRKDGELAWRGLDSAALLRMQRAINGIGGRAVMADPEFRSALAEAGFHVEHDGSIRSLGDAARAMSRRSAQVDRNLARYEAEHRAAGLGEPDEYLRAEWKRRAWNDGRPAKPKGAPAREAGWLGELRDLGVDVDSPRAAVAPRPGVRPGEVDRDALARRSLAVLASGARGRSTWNIYDARGAVEELLADAGLVADDDMAAELAEDVTARVVGESLTVLGDRPAVAGHIRHLTSQHVIDTEADINGRFAVRAAVAGIAVRPAEMAAAVARDGRELSAGQTEAVAAIVGGNALEVVEGPAGAGKTSVLKVAADLTAGRGGRLIVVSPSKKGALVAAEEVRSEAHTGAALAYAYGFRWSAKGVWSRLAVGDVDPETGVRYDGIPNSKRLADRDVLVVDEAGMCGQDLARALTHVADETGARLVLVGDRKQLPAVGRGGVIEMASRWTENGPVELDTVHRFRTADGAVDRDYADLSLRMRDGTRPGRTFDRLVERGQVLVVPSEQEAVEVIAQDAVTRRMGGGRQAIALPTNEAAAAVNEAVRRELVELGRVDDERVVIGSDGLRIGAGDQVTTRRNDHARNVANRDTWLVRQVTADGSLLLSEGPQGRIARLDAEYVRTDVHLGYAGTAHAVQGETVRDGTTLLTDASNAASLYVGLTRGRQSNTLVVVGDLVTAREQWVEAMDRDKSDVGLASARTDATVEASHYRWDEPYVERQAPDVSRETPPRPYAAVPDGELLDRQRLAAVEIAQLRDEFAEGPPVSAGEGASARERMRAQEAARDWNRLGTLQAEEAAMQWENTARAADPTLSVPDPMPAMQATPIVRSPQRDRGMEL